MTLPGFGATLPDWLRACARSTPDRPALECGAERWSFEQLDRRVDAATSRLLASGVRPGDRLALLAGNSLGFATAAFAVSRAGCVLVPLNLRLTPAELAWQLADCEPAALIADRAPPHGFNGRIVSVLDLSSSAYDGPAGRDSHEPAALHSIIYTSGTTGRPKGAMLSHGNVFWSVFASLTHLGLHADDRWLACLPLFHVGGLSILLRSVVNGTTAVIHETFDPGQANEALDRGRVTVVSLVSTMLQRMLEARGDRPYPSSLRCVLLGGGPIPDGLLAECLARGIPVAQTYGLTETASQVATLDVEDAQRKRGSAGRPLLGVEMRIEDEDGRACAAGEAGEILVRGPMVMQGYFRRPDESSAALRDGWLRTGDAGYLDSDGYLYVLDKRDDVIISGGENVYPAEVESVLAAHPDVREAGVFATTDQTWGQSVTAAVSLFEGATVTADDLRTFCRERLAGFKVPREIEFVPELPRNAAGKLLRREMRAAAESRPARS